MAAFHKDRPQHKTRTFSSNRENPIRHLQCLLGVTRLFAVHTHATWAALAAMRCVASLTPLLSEEALVRPPHQQRCCMLRVLHTYTAGHRLAPR